MSAFSGEGYSLSMTRGNECDEEKIKRLVTKFINGSEVKSNASQESLWLARSLKNIIRNLNYIFTTSAAVY